MPAKNPALAVVLLAIVLTAACSPARNASPPNDAPSTGAADWRADDEKYRRDLEAKLTSDTGWLTIAGLAFLTKPETTVGSDRSNDVGLPGATPARLGTFILGSDGHVSVRLQPHLDVKLLDGRPFTGGAIKSDGE